MPAPPTYWERDVLISPEGGERLTGALAAVFPDMLILECIWLQDPLRRVQRRTAIGECKNGKRYVGKLVETIDRCFSTWGEDVDLETGKVAGGPREIRWYSLDLREWCEAATGSFLFWHPPREDLPYKIGVRPSRAPV